MKTRFAKFSGLAFVLGMAGLPIYIHAPKFYIDNYGLSLATMGIILFALRLLDVIQDPLLGYLAAKTRRFGALSVTFSCILMGAGMIMLFTIKSPIAPWLWFTISLAFVFSGFSYLYIRSYAQGLENFGAENQIRLARWREVGTTLGICVAAVLPTVFAQKFTMPYSAFAIIFVICLTLVVCAIQKEFHKTQTAPITVNFLHINDIIKDNLSRSFLFLALINSSPVALSSTLFLFFVESRLNAPEWAGLFLIIFFLSAAASTPIWTYFAQHLGLIRILKVSMLMAILSFFGASFLVTDDIGLFALICFASGATLGADMALLPVLFAQHLDKKSLYSDIGFGLWNFVSKLSLAIAAIFALPLLETAGFRTGTQNDEYSLIALSFAYATLPCLFKIGALCLLNHISNQHELSKNA